MYDGYKPKPQIQQKPKEEIFLQIMKSRLAYDEIILCMYHKNYIEILPKGQQKDWTQLINAYFGNKDWDLGKEY